MVRHAFRYLIGQGVARGMVHFLSLALAKVLSSEDFVAFSFFLISANVYSRVANGSLNMVMARMRFGGEESERSSRQDRIYRFSSALGLGLTVLAIVLDFFLGISSQFGVRSELLWLALVSGYLISIENSLIEVMQSRFESHRYMLYMLSFTALLCGLAFVGWWLSDGRAVSILMLAYIAAQGLTLWSFGGFRYSWKYGRAEIRHYAQIGGMVCLYGVSTYLFRYLEVLIVNRYVGTEQMAAFMFVFRLMESLNLIILAAGAVVTPIIYLGLQGQGWGQESQKKLSLAVFGQMVLFAIFSAVLPFAVNRFEPKFLSAVSAVPLLFGSTVLILFIGIAQAFVLFYDRYKEMVIFSLLGLLVAALLGSLLAPSFGPTGILVAKMASQMVVLAGYIWSVRHEPVHFWGLRPWSWLLSGIVLFGLVLSRYLLFF